MINQIPFQITFSDFNRDVIVGLLKFPSQSVHSGSGNAGLVENQVW